MVLQFPISAAIAVLIAGVALSYAQTILAYPNGGGSYVVARSNLGTLPGLVAGGALLLDYILNAAVSLTAGVEALASAFPVFWAYRVWLALALLVLPEIIPARPWNGVLHNQSALLIKEAILYNRRHAGFNRIIIDVPYHLSEKPPKKRRLNHEIHERRKN